MNEIDDSEEKANDLFFIYCRCLRGDIGVKAVSYTHLDVYKRQALYTVPSPQFTITFRDGSRVIDLTSQPNLSQSCGKL